MPRREKRALPQRRKRRSLHRHGIYTMRDVEQLYGVSRRVVEKAVVAGSLPPPLSGTTYVRLWHRRDLRDFTDLFGPPRTDVEGGAQLRQYHGIRIA